MADEKDFSMDDFLKEFAKRLSEFVPARKISDFEHKMGLVGFRLDRVVKAKKGVNLETLLRICRTLDASPTYLLFKKGRKQLSKVRDEKTWQLDEAREGSHWHMFHRLPESERKEINLLVQEKLLRHEQESLQTDHETPPPRRPRRGGKKN